MAGDSPEDRRFANDSGFSAGALVGGPSPSEWSLPLGGLLTRSPWTSLSASSLRASLCPQNSTCQPWGPAPRCPGLPHALWPLNSLPLAHTHPSHAHSWSSEVQWDVLSSRTLPNLVQGPLLSTLHTCSPGVNTALRDCFISPLSSSFKLVCFPLDITRDRVPRARAQRVLGACCCRKKERSAGRRRGRPEGREAGVSSTSPRLD